MTIESISAVTLATHDMGRAVAFYRALGFEMLYGGAEAGFTSFGAGAGYLNLVAEPAKEWSWWGRAIFYVDDVDAMYERALSAGYEPDFEPRDAEWGERFFHLDDPDGHELSFAKPLTEDVAKRSAEFAREWERGRG
ncbi:MAG: VOC family protein [Rhodospirillales bacterium]|jgi:catechol 2,3-dioxygenase-like lactoylglutathione lyase family enzyme|nr:VOC family protein [Rhodospirillales bacterium]MDP6772966.1 VOC family protein [Rhodospirillales bacterium]|tara:strand:+ start:170 stop:580 length:411 start_codon:yes stop_codon:yes gene_type:complete